MSELSSTLLGEQSIRPEDEAYWLRTLGRRPRVLIAEDEEDLRLILRDVLSFAGFEVRVVVDGTELLEFLEPMLVDDPYAWKPDVIVSDICMPGAETFRVIRSLREAGWKTPLIFMSGLRDPRLEKIIDHLGQAIFLEKPLDLESVEEAVKNAVAYGIDP